jgi:hypothetical protein
MRTNTHAANSLASALASSRVWLLFGGVLLLSESVLLASTLFAAAGISFVATLLVAPTLSRVGGPRPEGADPGPATGDSAARTRAVSRAGAKTIAAGT